MEAPSAQALFRILLNQLKSAAETAPADFEAFLKYVAAYQQTSNSPKHLDLIRGFYAKRRDEILCGNASWLLSGEPVTITLPDGHVCIPLTQLYRTALRLQLKAQASPGVQKLAVWANFPEALLAHIYRTFAAVCPAGDRAELEKAVSAMSPKSNPLPPEPSPAAPQQTPANPLAGVADMLQSPQFRDILRGIVQAVVSVAPPNPQGAAMPAPTPEAIQGTINQVLGAIGGQVPAMMNSLNNAGPMVAPPTAPVAPDQVLELAGSDTFPTAEHGGGEEGEAPAFSEEVARPNDEPPGEGDLPPIPEETGEAYREAYDS